MQLVSYAKIKNNRVAAASKIGQTLQEVFYWHSELMHVFEAIEKHNHRIALR